jgi:hypothetical protein
MTPTPQDAHVAKRFRIAPEIVFFVVLWALAHLGFVILRYPEVLQGAQIDADGYMRLVRVGLLVETRAWFDGTIPRSNWPYGEVHHWTRPLDVFIIALALPFLPFLEWTGALAVSGALVSTVFHLFLCLIAVWIVRPLVPGPERFLAAPAVLVQPGLFLYGAVGRADHHTLIFLLFALALGAWIRALLTPERRGVAIAAGVLSGLGIWVSPESLLPLGLLFLSGGLAWVLRGDRFIPANLRLCVGLVFSLGIAIALERPPSAWGSAAVDRVSIAHLSMALLALGFWAGIRLLQGRSEVSRSGAADLSAGNVAKGWRERGLMSVLGGVAAVGVLAAIHPTFFRGPWTDVDPEVVGLWLQSVQELQPILSSDPAHLGEFLSFLGPALILIPILGYWTLKERQDPRHPVWVLLFASLLLYVPLASAQIRFSGYSGLIFAVVMVEVVRRVRLYLREDAVEWGAAPARAGLTAFLLAGHLLVGASLTLWLGDPPSIGDNGGEEEALPQCPLSQLTAELTARGGLGEESLTVAAFIDFGPELLYRTPHRILAGPYHRNADGILDSYHILASQDDESALQLATEREVDLILICPPMDQFYFTRGNSNTLYQRLLEGNGPDWLEEYASASRLPGQFRIFLVRAQTPSPGSATLDRRDAS